MKPRNKHWKFQHEKFMLARDLGYPGPTSLIFFEYHAQKKNTNEIGRMLDCTGAAVLHRLDAWRSDWSLRIQGGNTRNPRIARTNRFRFSCRACGEEFTNGGWQKLNTIMQAHECEESNGN